MNILLTNDDGISAEGINALYNTLKDTHQVFISAPNQERSACSNAFTVREEIEIEKIDNNRYAIFGYPADCVSIALHGDLFPKIDLVISGINHGPNLGADIHFSGTVAGARTAYITGVSAIAISIDSFDHSPYFSDTAVFLKDFIAQNENRIKSEKIFWNINYPNLSKDKIKGIFWTNLGNRRYCDVYRKVRNSGNKTHLKLEGNVQHNDADQSDITEVKRGFISITPLTIDSTNYKELNKERGC